MTKTKMTTVQKCNEILQGMAFLGIPAEKFSPMKEEYGGIDGLYTGIEDMMISYEVNEVFHGRGEDLMTVSTIAPGPTVKIAPAYQAATQLTRQYKRQTQKQATR